MYADSPVRPFDPEADYPVATKRPDLVRTPSGLALEQITLAALGPESSEPTTYARRLTRCSDRRRSHALPEGYSSQRPSSARPSSRLFPTSSCSRSHGLAAPACRRRRARVLRHAARARVRRFAGSSLCAGSGSRLRRARPAGMSSRRAESRGSRELQGSDRGAASCSRSRRDGRPGDPAPSLVIRDGRRSSTVVPQPSSTSSTGSSPSTESTSEPRRRRGVARTPSWPPALLDARCASRGFRGSRPA